MFSFLKSKLATKPVAKSSPLPPKGTVAAGGAEAVELQEQVRRGDLVGLRAYLARTHAAGEWQDRCFMLSLVAPSVRREALDFACDVEPEAADLFLIRCALFNDLAWQMRGGGTSDQLKREGIESAAKCVGWALKAFEMATRLDANDPTGYACVLPCLMILGDETGRQLRDAAVRATALVPDLVPVHIVMVRAQAERWAGSHATSLAVARTALREAPAGSDMAACLFWAHLLVQTHFIDFDDDEEAAEQYLNDEAVRQELEVAFDAWVTGKRDVSRSSIAYLHYAACWFYLAHDHGRLQRAMALIRNVYCDRPWHFVSTRPQMLYGKALLAAATATSPFEAVEEEEARLCLSMIVRGGDLTFSNEFHEAERYLKAAMLQVRTLPEVQSTSLLPLAMLYAAALLEKQNKPDDARTVRELGVAKLDMAGIGMDTGRYQHLMAQVLSKLGEYQRAVPFWERTVQLATDDVVPEGLAGMLYGLGLAYNQVGLRDHAVIPLRAALGIYRDLPEHPYLSAVLISLGNALRKAVPTEAEAYYKEAADQHVSQLRYESATPAWVNLGILCSEQGRYAESLAYYAKVLQAREQSPGTPPAKIATVYDNIANAHRRADHFKEAHRASEKSIKLFSSSDSALQFAYGTRALIFVGEGEDRKAVDWFSKARTERSRWPSANVDTVVDHLEGEIKALRRSGNEPEAVKVQEELTSLRAASSATLTDYDFTAGKAAMEGAVQVELCFGTRPPSRYECGSASSLAASLAGELRGRGLGMGCGVVSIPESTTLLFRGHDAEALFAAIEPGLKDEKIAEGARVRIRQGGATRDFVIPYSAGQMN